MSCPYIGTFTGDRPPRQGPSVNNVCHARPNPTWGYAAVDTEAQAYYCFTRSHRRCPRYQKALVEGVQPPVAASSGTGFRFPFKLFRRTA